MKSRNVYIIGIIILFAFTFMLFANNEKDYLAANPLYSSYSTRGGSLFVNLNEITEPNFYKSLEKDVAFIFLSYNFDDVTYIYNKEEFKFYRERILSIYDDLSEESVIERFENMKDTDIYLGHVNGYNIFDQNSYCRGTYETLFECDLCIYEVRCSDLSKLILHDGEDYIGTIKEGLEQELFDIDELFYVNISITKEDKE